MAALRQRCGSQRPLSDLHIDLPLEPSAEFSSVLLVATSGACARTRLQLHPDRLQQLLDILPSSSLAGLAVTWSDHDDTHKVHVAHAPRDTDQTRPSRGNVFVALRSPYARWPQTFFHLSSIISIGHTLHTMDLGKFWWQSGEGLRLSARDDNSHTLYSHLADLIDLIVLHFPALRDLSFTIDTGPDVKGLIACDLDVSPQRWGGALDRLTIAFNFYIEPRNQWFPYFTIAKNLASLCHSSTLIAATVELERAIEWQIDNREFDRVIPYPDWTFVEQDLGDLVHWLLSLSPARQAALRVADFHKLGLMPPARSAINWRELTFVDDVPVPIDLKRLSDEYHCWTELAEGSSAGAEEARKQKRMIDQLFSKTEGKV